MKNYIRSYNEMIDEIIQNIINKDKTHYVNVGLKSGKVVEGIIIGNEVHTKGELYGDASHLTLQLCKMGGLIIYEDFMYIPYESIEYIVYQTKEAEE